MQLHDAVKYGRGSLPCPNLQRPARSAVSLRSKLCSDAHVSGPIPSQRAAPTCLASTSSQRHHVAAFNGPISRGAAVTAHATAAHAPAEVVLHNVHKYRFFTSQGKTFTAQVQHTSKGAHVEVAVAVAGGEHRTGDTQGPSLHWGMYRASATHWAHPKEAVPPHSQLHAASGGMRTPMTWNSHKHAWTCSFDVPSKLLPLQLAAVLFNPAGGAYETPHRSKYFSIPVGMSAGQPSPPGAQVVSVSPGGTRADDTTCSVNFAVFSRHATNMYLCLVRVASGSLSASSSGPLQGTGVLEIALDPVTNRTGDMWHVCVEGLKSIHLLCYGWRAEGDPSWEGGHRFHPGYILCDPYATRAVPVLLPEAAYTGAPRVPPAYDVNKPVWLASLAAFTQEFDWSGAHRPVIMSAAAGSSTGPVQQLRGRALEESVYLELDVKEFTTGPDAEALVPEHHRGTYLGVIDRLQEIVASGATSVVLTPVCQCAPGLGPLGRNPLALFAPDVSYAVGGPLAAAHELKQMIQALHQAGLEVIMQVEFCLTSEGVDAASGGLQGLRGIDAAVFYRSPADGPAVLAAGHPVVRPMLLDCLKHWAAEYRVDGFCFVNAENLTQDRFGTVLDSPALVEDICCDPVLRGLKLIAAPSNTALLPRSGQRGFPHWGVWMQVNDRFRSDLTNYLVNNQHGLLSAVATRITGSADLFGPGWGEGVPGGLAAARRPACGVNALHASHETLLQKLSGSQASSTPGGIASAAGPADLAPVVARTLMLAQFVSSGIPIVSATTLSAARDKGLARFVMALGTLRKQLMPLLSPPSFEAPRELTWHGAAAGSEVDWSGTSQAPASNLIAFSLREPAPALGSTTSSAPTSAHTHAGSARAVYCALNPYPEPVTVAIPSPPPFSTWRVVVNTSNTPPSDADFQGQLLPPGCPTYELGAKGGLLLVSEPLSAAYSQPAQGPRAQGPARVGGAYRPAGSSGSSGLGR